MNKKHEIVVLIPHFNNPDGLLKSLLSINNFDDKVFALVVDDGSNNKKINKLDIQEKCKVYIDFLMLEENQGIEYALNTGLNHILNEYKNVKYIARLDCDDINLENRLKLQYDFLEKNRDISFIGSSVRFVDTNNKHLFNLKLPASNKEIKKKMYFNAMFIHPSIFFRKEILITTGLYPTNKKSAEDYAFFFNVIEHFKVANIQKALVECVMNPDGISGKKRKEQVLSRITIIKQHFYFGYYPIIGLIRNTMLLAVPQNLSNRIKALLKP
jgi:glycosyltransferase involved in cell wall biosynthesis